MRCPLLIVEDHTLTAQYLRDHIDWPSIGVDIVGLAADGKEALALIESLEPAIVLTDIRMPRMDGLELIRRIHEQNRRIKPVILSAYDDFSYARQAMRYGALDYVLKPIEDECLMETIKRVSGVIAEERCSQGSELLELMKRRFPTIKNDFLARLLKNGEDECCAENLTCIGIRLPTNNLCVILTQADHQAHMHQKNAAALINAVEAAFLPDYSVQPAFIDDSTAFVVCCKKQTSSVELGALCAQCRKAQDDFFLRTATTFSAGISSVHQGLSNLPTCYQEAKRALDRKFTSGPASVFVYSRTAFEDSQPFLYPFDAEQRLLTSIGTCDTAEVCGELDAFFSFFEKRAATDPRAIKAAATTMLVRAEGMLREKLHTADSPEDHENRSRTIADIDRLECLTDVKNKCREIIEEHRNLIHEHASSRVVSKALGYMALHYMENCGIEHVAAFVGYSPNYFSHIFKKQMKKSFCQVLTEHRVEHAKKLLAGTDMRIAEVAGAVGFNDPQYFSTIFFKITGLCPSDFRRKTT